MWGAEFHGQAEVYLVDSNCVLLVVQEDKQARSPGKKLPVGHLMAGCIAVLDKNNLLRERMAEKPLSDYLMPRIKIRTTTPYFHKIKVTQNLVDWVKKGECGTESTIILQHESPFPFLDRRMVPLANRQVTLQSIEAFKVFVLQIHLDYFNRWIRNSTVGKFSQNCVLLEPFIVVLCLCLYHSDADDFIWYSYFEPLSSFFHLANLSFHLER
jgi:hypothetical protein